MLAIFDVGEKDGIVWFTMPLVVGESLRARLDREKRLEPDEATRILRAAAAALHAAHRAGLVHRDVKPDNILLDGPERAVLLADFGVAAALEPEGDRITTEGTILGTPRYMSPEQAAGEPVIDARSDVYSLGVAGYEMLSGDVPFTAVNAGAVLAKHLTAPVPPLRVARCPAMLIDAVERCLAKDPADRWPTAEAFRQALEGRVSRAPARLAAAGESRATPRLTLSLGVGALVLLLLAALVDVRQGALMLSPIVLLVVAVAGGVSYGRRAAARAQVPAVETGAEAAKHLRRARALRTAGRSLLASMPKAERARLASAELVLDRLLFAVESATRDRGAATALETSLSALAELHGAIERAFEGDAQEGTARVRDLLARHSPAGMSSTAVAPGQ